MVEVGNFTRSPGEPITVRNPRNAGVRYRVRFEGAGYVELVVAPGGSFVFCGTGADVQIDVEDVFPAGIRANGDESDQV